MCLFIDDLLAYSRFVFVSTPKQTLLKLPSPINLPKIKSFGDFFGGVTANGGVVDELFGFNVLFVAEAELEAFEDTDDVDKVQDEDIYCGVLL